MAFCIEISSVQIDQHLSTLYFLDDFLFLISSSIGRNLPIVWHFFLLFCLFFFIFQLQDFDLFFVFHLISFYFDFFSHIFCSRLIPLFLFLNFHPYFSFSNFTIWLADISLTVSRWTDLNEKLFIFIPPNRIS